MASLSPFQEKKIVRVFRMLYDSNGDGVIDKKDFDALLKNISEILQWDAGSERYQKASDTLETVWKGLLEIADSDQDAKITKKEWLQMWGVCLKDLEKGQFPDWQKKYMELMFDVNDKSGDDHIDETEYMTFFSKFGISESDCKKAFQHISGGNNITRDKFAELWKQYLTSNNSDSPGNFLFGPNFDE